MLFTSPIKANTLVFNSDLGFDGARSAYTYFDLVDKELFRFCYREYRLMVARLVDTRHDNADPLFTLEFIISQLRKDDV